MADEKRDALKAEKAAAKAAAKQKREKIKKNKPKKNDNQSNIFVRIGKAIFRFFKDFRGTVKKVVWPDRKTIIKSTGIVLSVVLVVGACIWIVDYALSGSVKLITSAAEEYRAEEETEEEVTEEPTTEEQGETEAQEDVTNETEDEAEDETTEDET